MPAIPTVTCPRCGGAGEYQCTIEMVDPPVGKMDIGYCAACARLFEYIRTPATTYDSTSWPPVCRTCRQAVSFVEARGPESARIAIFRCREHGDERWEWDQASDTWRRR
jgi:hypothetical protein